VFAPPAFLFKFLVQGGIMDLLQSIKSAKRFQQNRRLSRLRDFISNPRKKFSKKDDKDDDIPKNPFSGNPPFGGTPALAF
jgi:hypothetical protein